MLKVVELIELQALLQASGSAKHQPIRHIAFFTRAFATSAFLKIGEQGFSLHRTDKPEGQATNHLTTLLQAYRLGRKGSWDHR